MDRKGRKRKDREKKVMAKKKRMGERRLKGIRVGKKIDRVLIANAKMRQRLESEILLLTLGIDIDNHTRGEAKYFLNSLSLLPVAYAYLSKSLDELFSLAHGKMPKGINSDYLASQIISEMRSCLKDFEDTLKFLFETRIGEKICDTDTIVEKFQESCKKKKDEIRVWIQHQDYIQDYVIDELYSLRKETQGKEDIAAKDTQHNNPSDEGTRYEYAIAFLVKKVIEPINNIERWRVGVPIDFYREVVEVVSQVHLSSAFFFLQRLYNNMSALDFSSLPELLRPKRDSLGMVRFQHVLKVMPEEVLPDPDFVQELKTITKRLDKLNGGEGAFHALRAFHACGESYVDALAKLEQLGWDRRIFGIVREMHHSAGDWKDFLLYLFCEYPHFAPAYETLKTLHYNPEEAAKFLCDYGDYCFNDTNLAAALHVLAQRKPEAAKLIVENALYILCGDSSQEMINLIEDIEKGTKALRHYIYFAKAEEPYKQNAVLRYIRKNGAINIDDFVEHLQNTSDEQVGEILKEDEFHSFVSHIISPEKQKPEETPIHRLKALSNFDLISKYGFAPEIIDLGEETLRHIDAALLCVRGSRYECILLGQRHLRQIFLNRIKTNSGATLALLSNLPEEGNPYLILTRRFEPPLEKKPEETTIPYEYKRVVLISAGVDPETLSFLHERLEVPVHVISVNAAVNKFNAICGNDMVVYDTSRTSHSSYYRAKSLAIKRKASFRHASSTNKDIVLEIIRS